MNTTTATAGLTYRTAATPAESRYSVRHWEGKAIVEPWFPTRDDRTLYLLSIGGAACVLTWQDPAEDYNGANVYGPGAPIR